MLADRDLGEGFEYILEVDKRLKPTPEQVLEEPDKYLVKRPSTPEERQELEKFVAFVNDPRTGKQLDSDILRSQATRFDPVVRYLDWLADHEPGSAERDRLLEMALDRGVEITFEEGAPLNLMGHQIDIGRNYIERLNILRWIHPFLQGLGRRLTE